MKKKIFEQKLSMNDFKRRTEKVCERKKIIERFLKSEKKIEQKLSMTDFKRRTEKVCERKKN